MRLLIGSQKTRPQVSLKVRMVVHKLLVVKMAPPVFLEVSLLQIVVAEAQHPSRSQIGQQAAQYFFIPTV